MSTKNGIIVAVMTKVEQDLARDGFSTIMTETSEHLSFAYTVGLEATWNHPELIVVGAGSEIEQLVLMAIVERIVKKQTEKDPQQLIGGSKLDKNTLGLSCDLRVHQPKAATKDLLHLATSPIAANIVRVYYEAHPLPDGRQPRLLQIVWPSVNGVWPGEESDATQTKTRQVLL